MGAWWRGTLAQGGKNRPHEAPFLPRLKYKQAAKPNNIGIHGLLFTSHM
jgi:hypothetical protein